MLLDGSVEYSFDLIQKYKEQLVDFQSKHLTESDTRCKIIDSLFKHILGWSEGNIYREEHVKDDERNKYIDYIFSSSSNNFIVEAKKTDVYFNLVTSTKKYKKSGVLKNDKAINAAITQACNYCKLKNIDIGCVSNGLQIIVFIVDNFNSNYDTYVFNGLDDILSDFTNLYNIFSPFSNAKQYLHNLLRNDKNNRRCLPAFSKRINEGIYNADEVISRNPIDSYVRPIMDEFFTDLTSDDKIQYLEECYCLNNRITQYDKQLTSLLNDNIPTLGIPVQDSSYFGDDFIQKETNLIRNRIQSDVMMIVGGVGAGKTTFIHRYFSHMLPQPIKKNVIWIYIDFIKFSDERISIRDYILKESLRQIRENYKFLKIDEWETLWEIYNSEITRLKNGSLKHYYTSKREVFDEKISELLLEKQSNDLKFSEDVLKYLSMKQVMKKALCITIDNADQMSEEFQKWCITTAFELSKTIKCLMLLSMREESYWKLKNIKPFDAYYINAYHISAPSVATMLSKRINVAVKYKGKMKLRLNEDDGKRYEIELSKLMEIISKSLYNKDSNARVRLFEALSVGNLRLATKMLGTFLTSGHTNTKEYIETYLTNGDYLIPYHAFVRSIALEDYKLYKSDRSSLINIIDIDEDGFYSHFTKLRILSYLDTRRNIDTIAGKGFINIRDMYYDFTEICNNEDNFRKILSRLINTMLVQADNGFNVSINDTDYIKITSAGYYYLTNLIHEFSYTERLCEDTPINSKSHYDKILNNYKNMLTIDKSNTKAVMKERLLTVRFFLEYLLEEEYKEQELITNVNIKISFVGDMIRSFNKQSSDILRDLYRHKAPISEIAIDETKLK